MTSISAFLKVKVPLQLIPQLIYKFFTKYYADFVLEDIPQKEDSADMLLYAVFNQAMRYGLKSVSTEALAQLNESLLKSKQESLQLS